MALVDGCLSAIYSRIHKAGHHLTVHSQDVQLLVQDGLWIRRSKAGGKWSVGCRGWGGWGPSNREAELVSLGSDFQQGTRTEDLNILPLMVMHWSCLVRE